MLRRLLIVASLASLLLGVTSAVLWVASYWRGVEFVWPAKQTFDGYHPNRMGACWCGHIAIARYWESSDHGGKFLLRGFSYNHFLYNEDLGSSYDWDGMLQRAHAREGFAAEGTPLPGAASEFVIAAPCWFLTLAFAVMPCGWVILRIRRRRRETDGRCAACGYDLRASTGRCPECGRPIRNGAMASSAACSPPRL